MLREKTPSVLLLQLLRNSSGHQQVFFCDFKMFKNCSVVTKTLLLILNFNFSQVAVCSLTLSSDSGQQQQLATVSISHWISENGCMSMGFCVATLEVWLLRGVFSAFSTDFVFTPFLPPFFPSSFSLSFQSLVIYLRLASHSQSTCLSIPL